MIDDLDVEKIRNFSSTKLCEMIVCDRYFSIGKNISVYCMEELARRRLGGETFDFESYIDASYKELPPLNFNILDLRSVLNVLLSKEKSRK